MKKSKNRRFTAQMAEKLIDEYQTKISQYIKKNKDILSEISDLKNSIDINQSIINSLFKDNDKNTLAASLKNNIDNYLKLLDKKAEADMAKNKMEQIFQNIPNEVQMLKEENENLRKELNEKMKEIDKVEKNLIKERKNALFKEAREEIFVFAPTQENLELFNKIDASKVRSKGIGGEKREIQILEFMIKGISEQLNKIELMKEEIKENKCASDKGAKMNLALSIDDIKDNNNHVLFNDNETESSNEDIDDDNKSNNEVEVESSSDKDDNKEENEEKIKLQIELAKKEVDKLNEENDKYKETIEHYKQNYRKLKEEIHCLTKLIKKSSVSTQDTQHTKKNYK